MKALFSLAAVQLCLATLVSLSLLAIVEPARGQADDPFSASNQKKAASKAGKAPPTAKRIDFDISVKPATVRRGQTFKVIIEGRPKPGFHTYPINQRTADQETLQLSTLRFDPAPGLKPLPPLGESEAEFVKDDDKVLLEYSKPFTWVQDILVLEDAATGAKTFTFHVKLQVCNAGTCVWGTHDFEETIKVSSEPAVPLTPELQQRVQAQSPEIRVVSLPEKGSMASKRTAEGTSTNVKDGRRQTSGIIAFMLAGVFWGAVSLVTPCVFPMIPITVSFFLKQSEKEHHRPITMALVYCATIVLVLTVAAVALLSTFRWLSTNPVMNFGLGALFVFFALSLFGMYEIELPQGLAQFTSSREGKGGLVGTIFMALTFTIISFACVAPFLGGFGGTSDTSNMGLGHRILGGMAFSVTFASPFFVLALFPTLMKKLPKSGNWLNGVKVVMGFLELAAALKFLRAGELVLYSQPVLFTYDLVLGLYVALSFLCGLYLLGLYRLPHDTPAEHLKVPSVMLSAVFLGLGLYLLPALFKSGATGENQRPTGEVFAWLDSFLLPDTHSDLPWGIHLDKELEDAFAKKKLVFIDFTGVTCTNCNKNEKNVFPKREIRDLLKQYALVKMYTDRVPNEYYPPGEAAQLGSGTEKQREDALANLQFQREKFDTEQLPLYVILKPLAGGKYEEISRYDEGLINNVGAFAEFLRKPLDGGAAATATAQAAAP